MLNEKNEIDAILNGKRINKKYTYRSCYLLAKYYKSLGYEHIKIREEIFNWANKYGVYITDDLNSIIQRVFKDKKDIIDFVEIKISNDDIYEIVKRFDKYNTRLTAFAILCYSKMYADKNRIFQMSLVGLSNWISIQQQNLSTRIIRELIDFDYIEKINKDKYLRIIRKNHNITHPIVYKIKTSILNQGDYIFYDDNIRDEFDNIITIYDTNSSQSNNIIK